VIAGRRSQLLSSGGMSRTFFEPCARSIAFSAAVTASDLIAAWPMITTPPTDAVHFQTPRLDDGHNVGDLLTRIVEDLFERDYRYVETGDG
jgi:hypothetical protein